MPDLFSTDVLVGIVQSLKVPITGGILDRYFPDVQTEESEEIHFDRAPGRRRVAPFVSPLVEGQIVESEGFTTDSFKPAYVKDKRVFDATRPFKRVMGEQIGGSMSPDQRMQILLAQDLADQIAMVLRRMELMAADSLRLGKVTVVGDKYPSTVVDFKRAAALTIAALTGTARWSQAGATILDNLQDWAEIMLKQSGVFPMDVVMALDVWKNFRGHASIQAKLDLSRVRGENVDLGAAAQREGLNFMGVVDNFNIWVYSGWYIDPADDTEKVIWPSGNVVMTSQALEGVRAFGAIKDHDNLQAVPWWPKSWTTEDPSVRYLMLQSAPLPVPYRTDASLQAEVLNGGA